MANSDCTSPMTRVLRRSDHTEEEWYDEGLMDFLIYAGTYGLGITVINHQSTVEGNWGEWFFVDQEQMTIYLGTYSDTHEAGDYRYTWAYVYEISEDGMVMFREHAEDLRLSPGYYG